VLRLERRKNQIETLDPIAGHGKKTNTMLRLKREKNQIETLDSLLGCYLKCTCSDINKEKEAKESKELRLEVSSVDHVLKVHCKVDLQDKVYLD